MNDLALLAWQGLSAARRRVVARPVPALALGGFALGSVVVVTGARLGAAPSAVPLDRWLGLLPEAGYRITDAGLGVAMLAAIVALLGVWLVAVRVSARLVSRQVWVLAAAWSAPFALGPPILSTDVYAQVAKGLLARNGFSPYHHGPNRLGDQRIVAAIDPTWRSTPSTDGPLATLAEHLTASVTGGGVIAGVILLRVVSVLAVVGIGYAAAALAAHSGGDRAAALSLTVLNPAVLIVGLSASPLTAVMLALLLGAVVAARRKRWLRAVLLGAVAAGVKPVAALAVPAIVATHVLARPRELRARIVLRDGSVALAALVGATFTVPFGLGWLDNLGDATHEHIAFAPSSVISRVIGWIVRAASFDDLATGGRIAAGTGAVIVVCYLFATLDTRPLERTLGYALLAAGLLSPVMYPPFLLWGTICLAPLAVGARRDWVIALSAAACVLTPAGFGSKTEEVTIAALLVIAAALVPKLYLRQRLAPPLTSRTAGRTSAR